MALVCLGAGLPAATQAPAPPAAPPRFNFGPVGAVQKVADNLYVVPGGGGNTTFYVASAGVVVVDMKAPGNGQAVLDRIRSVTDKPILHVVNTHVHFDHTGGNLALPEAVEVVAHANLAASLAKDPAFQGPDARRGLVDRTYTDRLTLLSGDDAIDLYNFGPSHTSGDSFVVFRKARAVATGDVFAGKGQPILDAMNGGSGVAYPDALARAITAIADVDVVIPGHAGVMRWQDLVDFADFNRRFLAHARTARSAGQTPLQAMDSFRATLPPTFKDYSLGPAMFTGPGGNFEPIFRELQGAIAAPAQAQRPREAVIEKLRDNLYVVTTGGPTRTNITFFVTERHGVVMFDTGDPGWGAAWQAALKKITDKPLTTIIISHTHSDHTGSLPEMGDPTGRVTVSHENVKKSLEEATCARLSACQLFRGPASVHLPTKTYKDRLTLFEGNDRIELYHFGRSHTNGDTLAVIPALRTLVMEDMFAWRGVPRVYVDDGGTALNFPPVMNAITSTLTNVDTVITGHSLIMQWGDLLEFRDYIIAFSDYVKESHKAGRSVADLMRDLPTRLARYRTCAPTLEGAAELRTIECRFRTDQAARNATIMYDELEGRVSTFGSEKKQ